MVSHLRKSLLRLKFTSVFRKYSNSSYKFIEVKNANSSYSFILMKKMPVNSLCLEMNQELIHAIDVLENLPCTRGVIFTSLTPVFSAGIDFKEIYKPHEKKLKLFWKSFQDVFIKLYSTSLVTIAAVNGACLAGGCAISFSCDYRVSAPGRFAIGLIPTLLGLHPPWWLYKSFENLVGYRQAEKMLCLGETSSPVQALEKGMVDEIVASELLLSRCCEAIEEWLKISDSGRMQTKALMRESFIEQFRYQKDDDLNTFVSLIMQPETQREIEKYLDRLVIK